MFKKIWADPVWSKVISAIIIGIGTICYTKFVSVTEHLTFREAFKKFVEIKVPFVYVLVAIMVYLFLAIIFRKRQKKEKSFYTEKQQKLRSFNSSVEPENGLLFRWGVFFDYQTPFIADLTVFCTKHGETPIRFMNGRCPMQRCQNSFQQIDHHALKNLIESDLINRWEQIK